MQLGLVELVVDGAALRQLEHRRRQVAARQAPRPRRDQRPAQAGAAAEVGDVELARRRGQRRRQRRGDERRRAIAQGRQLGVEARRELVEGLLDVVVAGALGRAFAEAGGEVVARVRVVGFLGQPLAEHRDRVVDVPGVDERARVRAAAPLARRQQRASPGARRRPPRRSGPARPAAASGGARRRRTSARSRSRAGTPIRLPPTACAGAAGCPGSPAPAGSRRARGCAGRRAPPSSVWRRCFSTLPRLFQMPATSGATSTARRSRSSAAASSPR